ncbi:uncharacterized protein PG986_006660 [Apiospora aurea]|uniref:NACHT domain-containing protein n=1 Tax=Apiospora aurea TaxID=335848 RepID=A0ABR1QAD1_9PEZI
MGRVPLIFVVHSLGGLVVKEVWVVRATLRYNDNWPYQAYMQSQSDPEYEAIIKGITAICFLATPHRGSTLAQTLNRILDTTLVAKAKQYVADLVRNSLTLQNLNDQFRHIAPKLDIVSFYETLPTPIGLKAASVMIVERDSLILGYPGEISKALVADRHDVCKYGSIDDLNYVTIRNVLKTLVSKIVARNNSKRPGLSDRRATLDLKHLLGLSELPGADYIFFRNQWTKGTNQWILEDSKFRNGATVLWLSGSAATGKSIGAAHIINSMVENGFHCHYYFVRHGDRQKRTLSLLIRSLALQLAQTVPALSQKLLEFAEESINFETLDPRVAWEKIYKSSLVKLSGIGTIYWVIDGSDEAQDPRAYLKLFSDISSSSSSIRVLFTSRRSLDISAGFERLKEELVTYVVDTEGHTDDLGLYIDVELSVSGPGNMKGDVAQRILESSQNNFLWVRLAVDRINKCYTHAEVQEALQELPKGMEAIYDRMAINIVSKQSNAAKDLAIKILQTVSCTFRTLKVSELPAALGEWSTDMLDLPRTVMDLCGDFVIVNNDGNATLLHLTARDYLVDETNENRPLCISKESAHRDIFMSSMKCMMPVGLRAKLDNIATLVVTYGYKTTKVWEISTGKCMVSVDSIESKTLPLTLLFIENDRTLLLGTDDRKVRSLSLQGDPVPTWEIIAELEEPELERHFMNSASHMAFSPDGTLIAVGYRRHPLSAWETDGPIHAVLRELRELVWHPHEPEVFGVNLEGFVIRWRPYEDEVEELSAAATKLAISKDGSLLATGDGHGRVKLFLASSFTLIHQIAAPDAVFGLAFSPDARRLGYYANVWEPSALVRLAEETSGETDSFTPISTSSHGSVMVQGAVDSTTSVATRPQGRWYCHGTERGVVRLHDAQLGSSKDIYVSRAKFTIEKTAWSGAGNCVCFFDMSKQLIVLSIGQTDGQTSPLIQQRTSFSLRQSGKGVLRTLMLNSDATKIFIHTSSELCVININSSSVGACADLEHPDIRIWIIHPVQQAILLGFGSNHLYMFDWNLKQCGKYDFEWALGQPLHDPREWIIEQALTTRDSKHVVLHALLQNTIEPQGEKQLLFFPASALQWDGADREPPIQVQVLNTSLPTSALLIPLALLPRDRLVFISRHHGVCCMQLSWMANPTETKFTRKPSFPKSIASSGPRGSANEVMQELSALPGDWVGRDCLALCTLWASEKSLLCPRNGSVAVVKCAVLG